MARSSRTRRGRRGDGYQAPAVKSRTREERRVEARPVEATAGSAPEAASAPRAGGGFFGFTQESWGELRKVDWPGQRQLISATVAVIVAVAVVGVFLWAADAALSRLVRDIILNI